MAEENKNGSVQISGPFGSKISAAGPIVVLLIVLIAANGAVAYLAMKGQDKILEALRLEHCTVVLDLWAHTTSQRGEPLNYDKMPSVLRQCMPDFLQPNK